MDNNTKTEVHLDTNVIRVEGLREGLINYAFCEGSKSGTV